MCSFSMVQTGKYKTREGRKERVNNNNFLKWFVKVEKENKLLILQERVSLLVKNKSASRN